MKKALVPIFCLFMVNAHAFEWEAGIREIFITEHSYSYNSDSSARIYRDVMDKGYRRISLHPRISYLGDKKSIFTHPRVRSSFDDLASANVRVTMADSKLTIKPLLFDMPGVGEARPLSEINPSRPDLALTTYSQVLNQYLDVVKRQNVDKIVVGSGIVSILKEQKLIPKFNAVLKNIRSRVNPDTNVVLEITSNDLKVLSDALNTGLATEIFNEISVVAKPSVYFPHGYADINAIRELRQFIETLLPGKKISLSRVTVPGCLSFSEESFEYYCDDNRPDLKEQSARLRHLKEVLLKLEKEGHRFTTVEILESHSDFEPEVPDYRYPYFNQELFNPAFLELPKVKPLVAPPYFKNKTAPKKTACIYYDKFDLAPMIDRIGEIHAVMLQTNLGAFRSWQSKRLKLSEYQSGDADRCDLIFYIATNFMQDIPDSFLRDAARFSVNKKVVWFNYKLPKFIETLKSMDKDPGFNAEVIIQPDSTPSPTNTDPGFFRYFDYKGETFEKEAQWNYISNNFASSPELNRITITENSNVKVYSYARHSKTNAKTPYAVRSGNIWYFADSPFTFIHYEDRYFILADLLWDIMGEKAPHQKYALVRVEDVAPNTNMEGLRWAINYFKEENIPFSLAVIPHYNDMVGDGSTNWNPVFAPITKYKELTALLRYARANGGSMIMHGVSHAVGSLISGYDGITGSDYEFWLYPENKPIPFDSVEWLVNRIDMGMKVFEELNMRPAAFEIPHYAASAMNYLVFAKMFHWNYHRSIYFPFEIESNTDLPEELMAFNCKVKDCAVERKAILQNISVKADFTQFAGIPVPYIIWEDAYGQSVIPETLGMIDFAFYSPSTWRPVSKPEDILRRAKKLRVVRGAFASFFWHPHMFNPNARYYKEVPGSFEAIGGKKSLSIVIKGLKEMGYKFVSIDDRKIFPLEK